MTNNILPVSSLDDVIARQAALERQQRALQARQDRQEARLASQAGGTCLKGLGQVFARLKKLSLGRAAGEGKAEQSVRLADLDQAIRDLEPEKCRLPGGLYRRLALTRREFRERFAVCGFDACADREAAYLCTALRASIRALRNA